MAPPLTNLVALTSQNPKSFSKDSWRTKEVFPEPFFVKVLPIA